MSTLSGSVTVFGGMFSRLDVRQLFGPTTQSDYELSSMDTSTSSDSQPESYDVVGPISSTLQIVTPLRLDVELTEDNDYLVSDDVTLMYGIGDTREEAYQDYISSLAEYYDLLTERAVDHPPTQALLHRIQAYLRPIKG